MKNILILEDDLIVQKLYKRALDKIHSIQIVGTVAEALIALNANSPDVFISDMRLPDGSGADAVAYCKEKHPGVAIIVVSGTLEDASGLEVYRKFEKPFIPEEIISAIQDAI